MKRRDIDTSRLAAETRYMPTFLCAKRQIPDLAHLRVLGMVQDDDTVKTQFDESDHEPGRVVGTIIRKRREEMRHNPQPGDAHPLSKPDN